MRRMAKKKSDHIMYQMSRGLPKEPTITDKEREDILRFVETEATEVGYMEIEIQYLFIIITHSSLHQAIELKPHNTLNYPCIDLVICGVWITIAKFILLQIINNNIISFVSANKLFLQL